MHDANLRDANLSCADLRDANLSGAYGDMRRIKTLHFERWPVAYTATEIQIGCQCHAIDKWRKWDSAAGRVWVSKMDENALAWAEKFLPIVLALVDASPAE